MFSKVVRMLGGIFLLSSSLKLLGVEFLTFAFHGEDGSPLYSGRDIRLQAGLLPFPCIFHYKEGGDTSCRSDFRILDKPQEIVQSEMPDVLKNFLREQKLDQTQYFEAYCMPLWKTINYFTHPWAMDRMVEDRTVCVKSGMFAPQNLSPIGEEIGVNAIVPQSMYFHDGDKLSSNIARFKIEETSTLAEAWFVSIYDPQDNVGKNHESNQKKRAIVVHWYFFPKNWDSLPEGMSEIVDLWDFLEPTPSLIPSFIPQK